MKFWVGKAKDLTPAIISRLFWQVLMAYTLPITPKTPYPQFPAGREN